MTVNDRPVTQGEYQAILNFGPTAFAGDARYLEVRYRIGTSTGVYTVQTGRQPILPVAYALSLRPGATVNGNVANPGAAMSAINTGTGVAMKGTGTSGASVVGTSTSWIGVYGESSTAFGVQGKSTTGAGTVGESRDWFGVYGKSTNYEGVRGDSASRNYGGVVGANTAGGFGVFGRSSGTAIQGESTSGIGVQGRAQAQVILGSSVRARVMSASMARA